MLLFANMINMGESLTCYPSGTTKSRGNQWLELAPPVQLIFTLSAYSTGRVRQSIQQSNTKTLPSNHQLLDMPQMMQSTVACTTRVEYVRHGRPTRTNSQYRDSTD